jgi:hypothetical protein
MAIYFVRAKIISRGNGQNALACSAYRSGSKLFDHSEEKTHDYAKRSGVLDTGLATPQSAPDWMRDRQKLWTAVEQTEKRKDSQLAREFIVAVPDGLFDKTKNMTTDIVRLFTDRGMVVDWALHQPSREGDDRNYHWHILTTMRHIEANGFGQKARDWNNPEYLDKIKSDICNIFNKYLLEKGLEPVDWRSYEQQGITDRAPQEHQGVVKTAIARKEARDLARLERQIKSKKKEIAAYDDIGTSRRTGDVDSGDQSRHGRVAGDDRIAENGLAEVGKQAPDNTAANTRTTENPTENDRDTRTNPTANGKGNENLNRERRKDERVRRPSGKDRGLSL